MGDWIVPRHVQPAVPGAAEAPLEALLVRPPGVLALQGGLGSGRSTALSFLAEGARTSGRRTLVVAAPEDPRPTAPSPAAEACPDLILIDGVGSGSPAALVRMAKRWPAAVIIVGASPVEAQQLREDLPIPVQVWRLSPILGLDERRVLLKGRGAPDPDALLAWAGRTIEGEVLCGNPLFLVLLARLDPGGALPSLWQLADRYLTRMIEAEPRRAELMDLLMHLGSLAVREGIGAAVASSALVCHGSADGYQAAGLAQLERDLGALVDLGLLRPAGVDRYRLALPYLEIVLAARAAARGREIWPVKETANSTTRAAALLIPAMSEDPLSVLRQTSQGDPEAWLAGVAHLPLDLCLEHRIEILKEVERCLLPAGSGRPLAPLRAVGAKLADGLPDTSAPMLLRLLSRLRPPDPRVLGALDLLFVELATTWSWANTCRRNLFPPEQAVGEGLERVRINGLDVGVHEVSNAAFERVLGPCLHRAPRANRDAHPRTQVPWLAAHAFARSVGGRLPTLREREPWFRAVEAHRLRSDEANLPHTADTLQRRPGPLAVDHPLSRDPSLHGLLHVIGNVREWCADGPGEDPDVRWAAGGSFKALPSQAPSEGLMQARGDLGFRVVWDPEEADPGVGAGPTGQRPEPRPSAQGAAAPSTPTGPDASGGAASPGAPPVPLRGQDPLDVLKQLSPPEFAELLYRLDAPLAQLSPATVPLATRAIELLTWAQRRPERMEQLWLHIEMIF